MRKFVFAACAIALAIAAAHQHLPLWSSPRPCQRLIRRPTGGK